MRNAPVVALCGGAESRPPVCLSEIGRFASLFSFASLWLLVRGVVLWLVPARMFFVVGVPVRVRRRLSLVVAWCSVVWCGQPRQASSVGAGKGTTQGRGVVGAPAVDSAARGRKEWDLGDLGDWGEYPTGVGDARGGACPLLFVLLFYTFVA